MATAPQSEDVRARLAEAERLDRDGRHTEAIDSLAAAARTGDAEALGRLGRRLLLGDRAPFLPQQAATMLADAARAGDAEAAGLTAVLLGGGFYAPQSWRLALDYLQLAAQLGSPSAREQLSILADTDLDSAASQTDDEAHWRRLRERVDLDAWTGAPAPRSLSQAPRVAAVEGLLTHAACRWLIGQSGPRLARAEVHDPRTGATVMGATRTNQVANFTLAETSLLNLLVQAKIAAAAGLPIAQMEAFAILNYAPGEEASEHFDFLDPSIPAYAEEISALGQRVATALVYLNDDYEGGETAFPELGLAHRGETGDVLIFYSTDRSGAPDPRTVHAGRPPTSGEKWVLSQFIRSKPIAPGAEGLG